MKGFNIFKHRPAYALTTEGGLYCQIFHFIPALSLTCDSTYGDYTIVNKSGIKLRPVNITAYHPLRLVADKEQRHVPLLIALIDYADNHVTTTCQCQYKKTLCQGPTARHGDKRSHTSRLHDATCGWLHKRQSTGFSCQALRGHMT